MLKQRLFRAGTEDLTKLTSCIACYYSTTYGREFYTLTVYNEKLSSITYGLNLCCAKKHYHQIRYCMLMGYDLCYTTLVEDTLFLIP